MNDTPTLAKELAAQVQTLLDQRRCVPNATYRLEFHRDHLTFRDAARIVPYLARLGISHVYASPFLMNHSMASHGYAIVDYGRLNPALGSTADYDAYIAALHEHGLGQILDVVPNHMSAAAGENAWWTDVLEHGPSSPYAEFFDIDWEPFAQDLKNRILLPVLGQQFGRALEAGELSIVYDDGRLSIAYFNLRLPLAPVTYASVLRPVIAALQTEECDAESLQELESIVTSIDHLPPRTATSPDERQQRRREVGVIQRRLRRLTDEDACIANALESSLRTLNGDAAHPESFDALEAILDRQVYRLSHWKAASDEVNYRRFFDVNELVAICTEKWPVFEASHRFVFDLLVRGDIDGLRIDHVDGLYDPRTYLWRLQWEFVRRLGRQLWDRQSGNDAEPGNWSEIEAPFLDEMARVIHGPLPSHVLQCPSDATSATPSVAAEMNEPISRERLPLYVLVEKILGPDEPLPDDWPIHGTSGYDFLNLVNGLFVDATGHQHLRRAYERFTERDDTFEEIVVDSKELILNVSMSSELSLLAHRLKRIAEQQRHSRDFTLNTLHAALRDIVVCFSVYRTYAGPAGVPERDRRVIEKALRQARRLNPLMDSEVYRFIRRILLNEPEATTSEELRRDCELFAGRFQQVTSPVMAKGTEDTAFYRYVPLLALNEVGGHPIHARMTPEQFHRDNLARAARFPSAMLSTSTHDTKRSEDVRARLNVLSEMPGLWKSTLQRWSERNRTFVRDLHGEPAPSRNDEYLFYQTLIGMWPVNVSPDDLPVLTERLQRYMEKAIHEAKERTSWSSPDTEYDQAVHEFVAAVLQPARPDPFLADLRGVVKRVAAAGVITACSQLLLKLTSPGVPDIYQGQELLDFSLVDPDNRRPVDFAARQALLRDLEQRLETGTESRRELCERLMDDPFDPRLKLFVTEQTLALRRQHAEVFRHGEYLPLTVSGAQAERVCAFARQRENSSTVILTVVPCRIGRLQKPRGKGPRHVFNSDVWADTHVTLPQALRGTYHHVFTGDVIVAAETLAMTSLWSHFPMTLLERTA